MRTGKTETPAAVGGSLLLVIFAVLCLTVFALLSLSTVQADGRLTKISAKAVAEYYEADTQAEEILADLRRGIVADGVAQEGDCYSYSCAVSDTQKLLVKVRILEDTYEILYWKTVSVVDWEADDSLNVWDGSFDTGN